MIASAVAATMEGMISPADVNVTLVGYQITGAFSVSGVDFRSLTDGSTFSTRFHLALLGALGDSSVVGPGMGNIRISTPKQSIIANRTNLPFTIDGYGVSYGTTSNALQLASQDLQRFWAGELTSVAAEVVRRLANFGYIRTVSLSLDELSRNMILAVFRVKIRTTAGRQDSIESLFISASTSGVLAGEIARLTGEGVDVVPGDASQALRAARDTCAPVTTGMGKPPGSKAPGGKKPGGKKPGKHNKWWYRPTPTVG